MLSTIHALCAGGLLGVSKAVGVLPRVTFDVVSRFFVVGPKSLLHGGYVDVSSGCFDIVHHASGGVCGHV